MYKKLIQCSYIENLAPEMILAIAATTPYLQVPAVRDAICKHVSFRPSIQVHVPVRESFLICVRMGVVTAVADRIR
jgi:hypothetical protein